MSSVLPWLIGAGVLFAATRPAQANTAAPTPQRDRPEPKPPRTVVVTRTPGRTPPRDAAEVDYTPGQMEKEDYWPDGVPAPPPEVTSRWTRIPTGQGPVVVSPPPDRAFEPRVGPARAVRFPDGFQRDPVAGVHVGATRRFEEVELTGDVDEARDLLISIIADVTNLQPSDLSYTRDRRGFVFTFQEPPARKPSSKVTLYGKWEVPPIPGMNKLVRIGSNLPHSFFKAYRSADSTDVLQLIVPG